MADGAEKPIRIAEHDLDQQRQKSERRGHRAQ
jgi:hypothetical protein